MNAFEFVVADTTEAVTEYKLTDGDHNGNELTEFTMFKDATKKEVDVFFDIQL